MARISELHQKWMKEPKYRKAHAATEDEFALAKAVIAARNRAGGDSGRTGPEDGNYSAGCRPNGRRASSAILAHASAFGPGNWLPAFDPV
jgi:hypothetical protein